MRAGNGHQGTNAQQLALEAMLMARGADFGRGDRIVKVQPNWFIDPIHGNDNNTGATANHALKTWKEFQDRIGIGTEITPNTGPGQITVTLLNDMPETDPLTSVGNVFAPGSFGVVQGQIKKVSSGTLSFSQDYVRGPAGSVQAAVIGDGGTLSAHIGLFIQITSGAGLGSIAQLGAARPDLGPNKVQVTEWATQSVGPLYAFGVAYGNVPTAGNKFNIVDFTVAYMGPGQSVYDTSSTQGAGVGGWVFNDLHFAQTANPGGVTSMWSMSDGNFSTVQLFSECIFDQSVSFPEVASGIVLLANCMIRSGGVVPKADEVTNFFFGGVVPFPGSNPGLNGTGQFLFDGNFAFIGNNGNDPGNSANFFAGFGGDQFPGAAVSFITCSFWNCASGYFDVAGFLNANIDSVSNNFGTQFSPGLFGTGNYSPIVWDGDSKVIVRSGTEGLPNPGLPVVPTLTADNAVAPYVGIDWIWGTQLADGIHSYAFDRTTGATATAPTVLRNNTWANLAVLIAAGGFSGPSTASPNGGHVAEGVAVGATFAGTVQIAFQAFTP